MIIDAHQHLWTAYAWLQDPSPARIRRDDTVDDLRSRGSRVGVPDLDPGEPDDGLLPVVADVADRGSPERAAALVAAECGGIEILNAVTSGQCCPTASW